MKTAIHVGILLILSAVFSLGHVAGNVSCDAALAGSLSASDTACESGAPAPRSATR